MTAHDLHAYACAYEHVCVCLSQIFVQYVCIKKLLIKKCMKLKKSKNAMQDFKVLK